MKVVNRTPSDLHQTLRPKGVSDAAAWSFVSRFAPQKEKDRGAVRSTGGVAIGAGAGGWRNNRGVLAHRNANERRLRAKDSGRWNNKAAGSVTPRKCQRMEFNC
jgi:hypothetical protein